MFGSFLLNHFNFRFEEFRKYFMEYCKVEKCKNCKHDYILNNLYTFSFTVFCTGWTQKLDNLQYQLKYISSMAD